MSQIFILILLGSLTPSEKKLIRPSREFIVSKENLDAPYLKKNKTKRIQSLLRKTVIVSPVPPERDQLRRAALRTL